jgi:hypothetical protein
MTWEDVTVPAVRDGQPVTTRVRFVTGDEACVVQVSAGEDLNARGEARDLFAALAVARRQLEMQGVQLACNGARLGVWPSGMLRQTGYGRRAYVLTVPTTAGGSSTVDIFEPAPKSATLATVDEQHEWFRRYWDSITGKGDPSGRPS